jgi:hypothetical protein
MYRRFWWNCGRSVWREVVDGDAAGRQPGWQQSSQENGDAHPEAKTSQPPKRLRNNHVAQAFLPVWFCRTINHTGRNACATSPVQEIFLTYFKEVLERRLAILLDRTRIVSGRQGVDGGFAADQLTVGFKGYLPWIELLQRSRYL